MKKSVQAPVAGAGLPLAVPWIVTGWPTVIASAVVSQVEHLVPLGGILVTAPRERDVAAARDPTAVATGAGRS